MKFLAIIFLFLFNSFRFTGQWLDYNNAIIIDDTVYNRSSGNKFSGVLTKEKNDEIVYKVRCQNGLREGAFFKKYEFMDVLILRTGQFVKGKLHGEIKEINIKTKFNYSISTYNHGVRDGAWITYYSETGKPYCKSQYKDGISSGIHSLHYENGSVYIEGQVEQGLAVGQWNRYVRENREVHISKITFQEGRPITCEGDCDGLNLIMYRDWLDFTKDL